MAKHITIEYCVAWNYLPRAAGLADELEQKLGIRPQLIKGGGGIFDVKLDGDLIFSKKQAGRFPAPGEVEGAIAARTGAAKGAT